MTRLFLTPVVLPGNPSGVLEAAPKQYVDAVDARVTLLDAYVHAGAWTTLSLATGWTAWGSGLATPAYSTDRGVVSLRGVVKRSGANTSGVTSLLSAVLAANLRPLANELFSVARTTSNTPTARVDITSGGDLTYAAANTALITNDGISLSGISWSTA